MKIKTIIIMLVLILAVWSLPLMSNTLYVSSATGKNTNPGDKENPIKEIDKAIAVAQPGDTINVAGGVYSGTFDIGYMEVFRRTSARGILKNTPLSFNPITPAAPNPGKP
jgi:hypothetical protein